MTERVQQKHVPRIRRGSFTRSEQKDHKNKIKICAVKSPRKPAGSCTPMVRCHIARAD
jgi:hypothetical protein